MPIIGNFPTGGGSGGGGLALAAVSNIVTQVSSGKAYIKWTDPDDMVVAGATLATWGGTLLVRKVGSNPTSRRDGVVVIDSKTRNYYSSEYFVDSGLADGVTYYYKFFPYTTAGAYTDSVDDEFNVSPTAQVAGIENWNVTNMTASEEAGNGKIAITWSDPAMSIVNDGVTLATWGATNVVVKAGSYPTSKDDPDAAFSQKIITRNQYASTPLIATGLTNGTTYYIAFFPETTDGGVNGNTKQRVSGVANRITISSVPSQSGSVVYNGNSQSPEWSGYDVAKMMIGGDTVGVNAGSYDVHFALNDDYRWYDGSTDAKGATWMISKAPGMLSLSKTSITLNSTTKSDTFTVERAGDGVITAESDDTSVAIASVNGETVVVSSVNDTTGTATITVSVAESTNYTAPSPVSCSVTAQFLPSKKALNNTTWDEIRQVSDAGQGANYWSVGDRKAVAVQGTVGTLSVNSTYYVYIIGFNHNGAANTIDFGTFKTALSGGVDICLTDSKYGSDGGNTGTKNFAMNHWGSTSSPYNTNYGGWKGCDARYDILGSTNQKPSRYGSTPATNRVGYDATSTTATSPVANTLMAALPSDLRAVMKPMTIYTDNTGNSSNVAANVTTSVDYLPLLSEYEVHGARSYANQYEMNYQSQYAYYANGNAKIKYRDSATTTAAGWWVRSPRYDSAYYFCFVYTDGDADYYYSRNSYGLAPAFRV